MVRITATTADTRAKQVTIPSILGTRNPRPGQQEDKWSLLENSTGYQSSKWLAKSRNTAACKSILMMLSLRLLELKDEYCIKILFYTYIHFTTSIVNVHYNMLRCWLYLFLTESMYLAVVLRVKAVRIMPAVGGEWFPDTILGLAVAGLTRGPVEVGGYLVTLLPGPDTLVGKVRQTQPVGETLGQELLHQVLLLSRGDLRQVTSLPPAILN